MIFSIRYMNKLVAQYSCGRNVGLAMFNEVSRRMDAVGQRGTLEVQMSEDGYSPTKLHLRKGVTDNGKDGQQCIEKAIRLIELINNADRRSRC